MKVDARIMYMSGLLFDMLEDRGGDYEGMEIPLPSISEVVIK